MMKNKIYLLNKFKIMYIETSMSRKNLHLDYSCLRKTFFDLEDVHSSYIIQNFDFF